MFSVVVQLLVDESLPREADLLQKNRDFTSNRRRACLSWLGRSEVGLCESDLVVRLAVLPDDPDPGQHVVPALGLQQVLAEVLRGQPQGVFSLGLAVGDVDEAAADADGGMLVLAGACAGAMKHGLSLVLVEEEGVRAQHREDALPRSNAAAHFLQRERTERREEHYIYYVVCCKTFQHVT